ncbi:hypothetical protein KUTeg_010555 [Tegillarca granosa]|uniref:Uncharacterized protein n=1 Tax=Tegillarca granosa TaxID=220873 RepID=A0ABQ9F3H6_TEGGR|nr:hypothetical protein KUTeg_010555 [Tegillarca granosa]
MEEFVKKLMLEADLGVLTKRMVREEYCKVAGKHHLTEKEKNKINQLASKRVENENKENDCLSPVTSPTKQNNSTLNFLSKNIENTRNLQLKKDKTVLITKKEKSLYNQKRPESEVTNKGGNSLNQVSSDALKSPKQNPDETSILKESGPSPNHSPRLRVEEVLEAVMKSDSESDSSSENGNGVNDSNSESADSDKQVIMEDNSRLIKKTTRSKNKQAFKRVKRIKSDSESEGDCYSGDSSVSDKEKIRSSKLNKVHSDSETSDNHSRSKRVAKIQNYAEDSDSESDVEDRKCKSVKRFQKRHLNHKSKISNDSDTESDRKNLFNKYKSNEVFHDTKNSENSSDDSENNEGAKMLNKNRGQKRKHSSQTGSDVSVKPSKKYSKKGSTNGSDVNPSSSSEDNQPLFTSRKKNVKKVSTNASDTSSSSSSEDDQPLSASRKKNVQKCSTNGSDVNPSSSSEDDQPLSSSRKKNVIGRQRKGENISKIKKEIQMKENQDDKSKDNESVDKVKSFYGKNRLKEKTVLKVRCEMSSESENSEDELALSSMVKETSPGMDENEGITRTASGSDHEKKKKNEKKILQSEKSSSKESSSEESSSEDDNIGSSDSDNEVFKDQADRKKKTKPVKKSPKSAEEESSHVKNLKKICRVSGIIIRNTKELEGCETDSQKVKRLKDILSKAGMTGQPSLKKAERLKLKKEAAELDTGNIISSENGRRRRNVNSVFSRRQRSPSPDLVGTQIKQRFSRLKDIIDSEGSSD